LKKIACIASDNYHQHILQHELCHVAFCHRL